MRVEFVNPFVSSACSVFQKMLGCTLKRGALSLKSDLTPIYEVNGLIGLGGRCQGMVVVSIGRETAIKAASILLDVQLSELNDEVLDAVGELTNMIVGCAKTQLEEYRLNIGLPTVICGKSQSLRFPPVAKPIVIPFESDIGSLCIEVGLVELEQQAEISCRVLKAHDLSQVGQP